MDPAAYLPILADAALPPSIEQRLDAIIAVVTVLVVFLGTLLHLARVARARLQALIAVIKGTESALEPLKDTVPGLYRTTKDEIKAVVTDLGAQALVAKVVEEHIHGDGKPGSKPHTNDEIKAVDEEGDVRGDDR